MTLEEAIRGALEAGLEVNLHEGAKAGFSVDLMRPYFDEDGEYEGADSFTGWNDEPFESLAALIAEGTRDYLEARAEARS